jgi:DNA polymerase III delta prime subunit
MNGFKPNCLDDFLISNDQDRRKIELILSRQLPFPFGGKSGILFHGTWGTGKSTLATLLPGLIEMAFSGDWDLLNGVGQMPPPITDHCQKEVFRCGGGLSSTAITQTIHKFNMRLPLWHYSHHDYFVFDEVDRLTMTGQQSLRSTMDLNRCMFFFTTNYLSKIDPGIVNRCHLIEMNQVANPQAYVPIGQAILRSMGVDITKVSQKLLEDFATKSRGSIREFTDSVAMEAIDRGGELSV